MSTDEITKLVLTTLDEGKGRDAKLIDIKEKSSFADYMVIATGTSERHVKSLASRVIDEVKKRGLKPLGSEGEAIGDWVLVDMGDVVIHVMTAQTRGFYQLEKLWEADFDAEISSQLN